MESKFKERTYNKLPLDLIKKQNIINDEEETQRAYKLYKQRCDNPDDLFMMTKPYGIKLLTRDGYDVEAIFIRNSDGILDTASYFRDYLSCPAYLFDEGLGVGEEAIYFNVVLFVKKKKMLSLDEVLQSAKKLMIFEKVSSPVILGTIIRQVTALGFDSIIFTANCPNIYDKDVIRTSTANLLNIPFTMITELDSKTLDYLKEKGFKTVSYTTKDDVNTLRPDDVCLKEPTHLAYVFKEEDGEFVDSDVNVDYYIKLPDSLNNLDIVHRFSIIAYELGGK